MTKPSCALPECDKPARTAKLCSMHYIRQYRHGRTDALSNHSGITASYGRRYRSVSLPMHPIAGASGKVYEHRVVLYDTIGPGPHPCHWCGTSVDWLPKGQPGCLHVDHLNHIGDDNRPENLVPSCQSCNTRRGAERRHQALVAAGWWSGHGTIARGRCA